MVQSKGFISIVRLLNEMEKDWIDEQKQFHQLKILEKIEKGKNQSMYTQKCLQQCKGWNGPATSVEELHTILNSNPDKRVKIVRTELSFYRDTHKADVIQQPDLFKINNISHEEQLLNLCALLAEHDPARNFVSLPSNKDAATVLSSNSTDPTPAYTEKDTIEVGKILYDINYREKDEYVMVSCFMRGEEL